MAFFHGITVTEVNTNGVSIQVVNSAVIGLIGSAPQWSASSGAGPGINVPTLIQSAAQGSNFGKQIAGYTIPEALADIQLQGAGAVIVIDVFNPLLHQSTFTTQSLDRTRIEQCAGDTRPHGPNWSRLAQHPAFYCFG